MIAGVILLGGRSSRMGGGDKALLPLGGQPMLTHVVARFRPQVDRLALNANGDPARFAACGLPVLPDTVAGFPGPLAGVLAGMDWAAEQGVPLVATAAGDTPFFPATLVSGLCAAMSDSRASIAVAATETERGPAPHPTFGLWSVDLRADLRAALADGLRRVSDWTARHGAAAAVFAEDGAAFFNVNTPADLGCAEAMLARRSG